MGESNKVAKGFVRSRIFKTVGIIAVGVSTPTLALLLIVSLLPRGNNGFTMKMDPSTAEAHFSMYGSVNSLENNSFTTVIAGQPIKNGYVTRTSRVMDYIDSVKMEDIAGSKNLKGLAEESTNDEIYDLAIVHTVFLGNDSDTEDQKFIYTVSLEGYKETTNKAISPYEYLRIVCQTSLYEAGNSSLDISKQTSFYGAEHSLDSFGTSEGLEDMRETLSSFKKETDEETMNTVRVPKYSYGDISYCNNFLTESNDTIVKGELTIPAGKIMRFTFASYFEGADPDCYGAQPSNSEILLNLHFGV